MCTKKLLFCVASFTIMVLTSRMGPVAAQAVVSESEVKIQRATSWKDLLPPPNPAVRKAFFSDSLEGVPEVSFAHFAIQRTRNEDAYVEVKHLTRQITNINFLNSKGADHFMDVLLANRPDLAGLPFLKKGSCRMKSEDRRQLRTAAHLVRQSLAAHPDAAGFWRSFEGWRQTFEEQQLVHLQDRICATTLSQILAPHDTCFQSGLITVLEKCDKRDSDRYESTRLLMRLAIFAQDVTVRQSARAVLKKRKSKVADDVLRDSLRYPWLAIARNAIETVVALNRSEMAADLVKLLEEPDSRAPVLREGKQKKVWAVRELVRINHLRNCLLCHPPGTQPDKIADGEANEVPGDAIIGRIPIPGRSLPPMVDAYGLPSPSGNVIRADITYLRPDFSITLPVANAAPWPDLQRFDFLVRTRVLDANEVVEYDRAISRRQTADHRRAIAAALRRLTGKDAGGSAQAWRMALGF